MPVLLVVPRCLFFKLLSLSSYPNSGKFLSLDVTSANINFCGDINMMSHYINNVLFVCQPNLISKPWSLLESDLCSNILYHWSMNKMDSNRFVFPTYTRLNSPCKGRDKWNTERMICSVASRVELNFKMSDHCSRVVHRSKALHLSARGVTTDTLVRVQAVSQLAVVRSPIGRCTIGPVSSGFGRCRLSL